MTSIRNETYLSLRKGDILSDKYSGQAQSSVLRRSA